MPIQEPTKPKDFIREIVAEDLKNDKNNGNAITGFQVDF